MKKIFAVLILGIVILGCNNNSKVSENPFQDEKSPAIELNGGQKWIVNEEMKPYINKAKSLTNDYLQNKSTDYVTLAQQLKKQNDQLIKSCTMDGKAHDELHKWLHPHMILVSHLEKAETAAKADAIVLSIKDSFETFERYFE